MSSMYHSTCSPVNLGFVSQTGGTAVILGATGKNFGAGMSGGVAYVYDKDERLERLVNEDVAGDLHRIESNEVGRL